MSDKSARLAKLENSALPRGSPMIQYVICTWIFYRHFKSFFAGHSRLKSIKMKYHSQKHRIFHGWPMCGSLDGTSTSGCRSKFPPYYAGASSPQTQASSCRVSSSCGKLAHEGHTCRASQTGDSKPENTIVITLVGGNIILYPRYDSEK